MKTKWTQPELLADDHHGQHMMQLLFEKGLRKRYLRQLKKKLPEWAYNAILAGPDNESHYEACDLVNNATLTTETGQKWSIQYAEGGLWAIPACFMRTKQAEGFFGC